MGLGSHLKRLAVGLLLCAAVGAAGAHVMVAQRGTLNLQGDAAFLVVSLPVSAFAGVDDDHDGKMSARELRVHQPSISDAVLQGVRLLGDSGQVALLQGMMLSVSGPDESPEEAATQLLVMGRFPLGGLGESFRLQVQRFGSLPDEQSLQIKATRGDDAQWLVFTPESVERTVFASSGETLWNFVQLGMYHLWSGWDHLLFLLLVLIAQPAWRPALYALSCFTLGHAITLGLGATGRVTWSPAWVEPAILATIVGMAAFELQARRLKRRPGNSLRLALVFACALIHGLGLGNSLLELGLDSRYRMLSLLGFNVGIELGQIAVAACVLTCMGVIRSNPAHRSQQRATAQQPQHVNTGLPNHNRYHQGEQPQRPVV